MPKTKDKILKDDSDDDMARTPDIINLSEVTANDDEQNSKKPKSKKEQVNFEAFDVSSKEGFKELMRF